MTSAIKHGNLDDEKCITGLDGRVYYRVIARLVRTQSQDTVKTLNSIHTESWMMLLWWETAALGCQCLCKVMQYAYLFALRLGAMLLLDELKVELFLLFLVELLELLLQ